MPRGKVFDKKTAINYKLVHRAQNDPRIHDTDASDMVFTEVEAPNMRGQTYGYEPAGSSRASQYSSASKYSSATGRAKIKSRGDLENEFGLSARKNEGEAANHGIFYDDTKYDYMQHMRELGQSGGAYFVEAPADKKKGKNKMDLADALRASSLDDRQSEAGISVNSSIASRAASDVFGDDLAASEFVRKTTYQDQQNIPDAIAGFQPDMDPRLREVLEALEDEAYVDDEEDFFAELTNDPAELNQREFGSTEFEEDDDIMNRFMGEEDEGWETDDTIKASSPSKAKISADPTSPDTLPSPDDVPAPAKADHMAFMEEFKKFKSDAKSSKGPKAAAPSDVQSSVMTGVTGLTEGGRKKKRKGALTNPSTYSMTSSALHRTEGLTLLDQRFDKIEEEYASEDFPDDMSMVSGMSKISSFSKMSGMSGMSGMSNMSEAPQLRSDFDSIMDDFLGSHSMAGNSKTRVRKGKPQSGIEQLDEVRKGLGPARFYTPKTRKV